MLPKTVRIKIEGSAQKSTSGSETNTAAKLGSTDHTTIGLEDVHPFSQHLRGPNGKPAPIEGAPLMTDNEIRT
jgi:hypothetical protein